jgi:hypothetical protein
VEASAIEVISQLVRLNLCCQQPQTQDFELISDLSLPEEHFCCRINYSGKVFAR